MMKFMRNDWISPSGRPKKMADRLTAEQRSRCMSQIRSKNTHPEIEVRRLLHGLGYRFRLHRSDLPGKPDIVLPKYRSVIFVNGCFWHGHPNCKRASRPASNGAFWRKKLDGNIARDRKAAKELKAMGWRVLIVWECQIRRPSLENRICRFLKG